MRKRKALLFGAGVLVVGLLAAAGLILHRLAREREARRRNNLGVALMDLRRYPEAIAELELALQALPGYATARYNLGLARYRDGKLEQALATLEGVLKEDPDHIRGRYVLGLLRRDTGAWKEAAEHFAWIAGKDLRDARAWVNLGRSLLQGDRYPEAEEALRKGIALAPSDTEPRYYLFRALMKLGRKEEAAAELAARERWATTGAFILEKEAKGHMLRDKHAEPLPDSEARREAPERSPRYVEVTREVGLDFRHAGARDDDVETALASKTMPRTWFEDPGNRSRLVQAASAACAFLDLDNDGKFDILLLNVDGGHALLRQLSDGKLADATAAVGLGRDPDVGTACVAGDVDNDGWTDVFIAGHGDARLYRNAGGKLEDVTQASGIAGALPPGSWCSGAAFADVDHDADLDIHVTRLVDLARTEERTELRFPDDFAGQSHLLFRNNRDGTFTEIAREAHAGETAEKARAALFTDVNEEGAIDLVTFDWRGTPSVYLNARDGTFRLSEEATPPQLALPAGEARAHGDYDRDGAPDLLIARSGAAAALFRNLHAPRNWLTVRLEGLTGNGHIKSNRMGIGGAVEVRSPETWRRKEVRAGNGLGGCDAPEVYFDLGGEEVIDFARGFFPSGARGVEKEVKSNQVIVIKEIDLTSNSCPTVFAWDGARFDFITDTISAGILGELIAPGRYWQPDPDEWIRIEGARLQPIEGRLEVRWVNPLEEVTYLDAVRLVAVDHPEAVEVYPGERMVADPANRSAAKLYVLERLRPIARALDGRGAGATEVLSQVDRSYFDRFGLLPFHGFAADWELTIDLGPTPGRVLLLHGWTHWNSSASVIAASQAKKTLWGPVLEVRDPAGAWRTGIADLGVPAGLPRAMLVDLQGVLREGESTVRIRTNRMVYFDQALVADAVLAIDPATLAPAPRMCPAELPLRGAELRRLGYPRRVLPGGRHPEVPDYSRIEPEVEWGTHVGFLTRFGDVRELLTAADGRFAVMGHGEEVALTFDAAALAPLAPAWKRTFVLYSNGYEKGRDLHGAYPFTVDPLPFPGREAYPCPGGAAPADEARLEYLLEWNTRSSGGDE